MSLVDISPDVLEYKSPLTRQSTEYVTVKNNSDQPVAFKVKTTAPKFYCVRPNASVVAPGETVDVQVIFLGLPEAPQPDYKCRDKFLVITLPSPYDLGSKSVSEAWADLEAEFKQQAISKKIKVKYLINSEVEKNPESVPEEQPQAPKHESVTEVPPAAPQQAAKAAVETMSSPAQAEAPSHVQAPAQAQAEPQQKHITTEAPAAAFAAAAEAAEKVTRGLRVEGSMPKTETVEVKEVREEVQEVPRSVSSNTEKQVETKEGNTSTILILVCVLVLLLGWLYR
ncbi:Vesicle-associated membrane protein-associated protein SCS2 [Nakaseomyces bracarensis]|uniref:Vesicle-associated membrane protein-associated protein SCS2 n=1 Tax=Nakaseomyces bracarensis TaxID=273131 RepID=A0ABR4P098_9SACH